MKAIGRATAKLCIQRPKNWLSIPVFSATNSPDIINAIMNDMPKMKAILALNVGMARYSIRFIKVSTMLLVLHYLG